MRHQFLYACLALLAVAMNDPAARADDWLLAAETNGTFADLGPPPADVAPWDEACYDCGYGSWWDNTSLFIAGDGWRTRADDDYPGNFGLRTGFNSAFGCWDSPIRLQLGGSLGGYDWNGRDGDFGADPVSNDSVEVQLFVTAGIYKRSDICNDNPWAWGGVIDFFYDDNFGEQAEDVFIRQFRGQLSYAVDEANEFGTWFAFRMNWARYLSDARGPLKVRSLDQMNLYWHHNWEFGGDTWLYVGGANEPAEWILGLTGQAPLSSSVALFGGISWGIPSAQAGDDDFGSGQNYAEEYWNVSFGIIWYPGCKAASPSVSSYGGLPLLPVADNGSLMVKAPAGNL